MRAPLIVLTSEQRQTLEHVERAATAEQRAGLRARVILRAAEAVANTQIAEDLKVERKTVGKWRARFSKQGMDGLVDAPRSGRPQKFDVVVRCQVIAVACSLGKQVEDSRPEAMKQQLDGIIEKLAENGALNEQEKQTAAAASDTIYRAARTLKGPKDDANSTRTGWTMATLAEAVAEAEIAHLSRSSVWRFLHDSELKPHQHKMWLHSPDPDFKRKVTEVCQLYLNPPRGASVICVDEKTGMQILRRIHPGRPAAPGQSAREEFEYERQGTMCLFAGFEVGTGQVFGRLRDTRSGWDLRQFMEELAKWRPDRDIHVVWDNLNTHSASKWEAFSKAHGGRFHFHYTPIHASWVNQVECFFSIFTRRVLRHASFSCRAEFMWKARTFLAHWNQHEAKPFRWKFAGYRARVELEQQQAA
jgi:transposase